MVVPSVCAGARRDVDAAASVEAPRVVAELRHVLFEEPEVRLQAFGHLPERFAAMAHCRLPFIVKSPDQNGLQVPVQIPWRLGITRRCCKGCCSAMHRRASPAEPGVAPVRDLAISSSIGSLRSAPPPRSSRARLKNAPCSAAWRASSSSKSGAAGSAAAVSVSRDFTESRSRTLRSRTSISSAPRTGALPRPRHRAARGIHFGDDLVSLQPALPRVLETATVSQRSSLACR